MVRDKVAVFDREPQYGTQLANYAKQHPEYGIDFLIFTKADALMDYIRASSLSLLLVSELLAEDFSEEQKTTIFQQTPYCYLTEEKEVSFDCYMTKEMEASSDCVFRYQAMGILLRQLREVLDRISPGAIRSGDVFYPGSISGKDGEVREESVISSSGDKSGEVHRKRLQKMICVVSPSGGCGKTTMAKKLACREADMHKTFLLPLELYPDKPKEDQWKPGFSELLYYMRENDKKLEEHFHSMICTENPYGTIYAGDSPMDYLYLTPQDLKIFIDLLVQSEHYEVLVADIGFMNSATIELLEDAEEIVLLNRKDECAIHKMECWREGLIHMGKESLFDRMIEAG